MFEHAMSMPRQVLRPERVGPYLLDPHNKVEVGSDAVNQVQRLWRALSAGLAASTFASLRSEAQHVVLPLSTNSQDSHELSSRGKRLRADLNEAIKTRPLTGHIDGTDVTDVVRPYVSAGMTFKDAEAVLRDAGFTIHPHPDPHKATDINRTKDWYTVLAAIPHIRKQFLFRTDLYVSLLSKSPGDYTDVTDVRATVFVTGP